MSGRAIATAARAVAQLRFGVGFRADISLKHGVELPAIAKTRAAAQVAAICVWAPYSAVRIELGRESAGRHYELNCDREAQALLSPYVGWHKQLVAYSMQCKLGAERFVADHLETIRTLAIELQVRDRISPDEVKRICRERL
jgi:hypothetical protein